MPIVTAETRRLTIEMLEGLQSNTCSICQIVFQVRDYIIGLSCGHGFHRQCFYRWTNEVV